MTGSPTLRATEAAVHERLAGLDLDNSAMRVVSNIYRASTAVRNHLEQTALRDTGLTWTGFVVLWVIWIWGESESRHVAEEAGISKATLSGVVKTLESYRYIQRRRHASDGRRIVIQMSPAGRRLMKSLIPDFNQQETFVVRGLTEEQRSDLTGSLRRIVEQLETVEGRTA